MKRTSKKIEFTPEAEIHLSNFSASKKSYVFSQMLKEARRFYHTNASKLDETTINEKTLDFIEPAWSNTATQFEMVSGKEAMSALNKIFQKQYKVSVTSTAIIDAMRIDEISMEMISLIDMLGELSTGIIDS